MSQMNYISITPNYICVPVGTWMDKEITFTNITNVPYDNIIIALKSSVGVDFKEKRLLIKTLKAGEIKSIILPVKIIANPEQKLMLELSVYVDVGKRPQKLNLPVLVEEKPIQLKEAKSMTELLPEVKDINEEKPIQPKHISVREFKKELRKLTNNQLADLCQDYEEFKDLEGLFEVQKTNADRIREIIKLCDRREKFHVLHIALEEALGDEYAHFSIFRPQDA